MKVTRFFIVLLVLLLSFTSFAGICPCCDNTVGGFNIGPQMWSFRLFTFSEALLKAKHAGANVVECYPGQRLAPWNETEFNHNASPAVWAKAKLMLDSLDIKIVNYGVVNWNSPEEARRIFQFAKLMGIPAITTEPGDRSKANFDLMESLIKEFDIKVGIHNHPIRKDNPDYVWWNPEEVLKAIKGRDMRLGFACDTGHWTRSNIKPIDGLKVAEGRIISVHMKDLNEFGPDAHDMVYGQGVGDMKAVLTELKRQGFAGNISIEYEYDWENNVDDIAQCIEFVRVFGKICK